MNMSLAVFRLMDTADEAEETSANHGWVQLHGQWTEKKQQKAKAIHSFWELYCGVQRRQHLCCNLFSPGFPQVRHYKIPWLFQI